MPEYAVYIDVGVMVSAKNEREAARKAAKRFERSIGNGLLENDSAFLIEYEGER